MYLISSLTSLPFTHTALSACIRSQLLLSQAQSPLFPNLQITNMKFLSLLTLATAALAAPTPKDTSENPEFVARQVLPTSENGLKSSLSRCGDVVLIFARGSTEVGNMGTIIGPDLRRALERALPRGQSLTTQGVDYAALLSTNYLPGGTDTRSENEMKDMLRLAHTKCPDAQIVVSGYR